MHLPCALPVRTASAVRTLQGRRCFITAAYVGGFGISQIKARDVPAFWRLLPSPLQAGLCHRTATHMGKQDCGAPCRGQALTTEPAVSELGTSQEQRCCETTKEKSFDVPLSDYRALLYASLIKVCRDGMPSTVVHTLGKAGTLRFSIHQARPDDGSCRNGAVPASSLVSTTLVQEAPASQLNSASLRFQAPVSVALQSCCDSPAQPAMIAYGLTGTFRAAESDMSG